MELKNIHWMRRFAKGEIKVTGYEPRFSYWELKDYEKLEALSSKLQMLSISPLDEQYKHFNSTYYEMRSLITEIANTYGDDRADVATIYNIMNDAYIRAYSE